MFEDFLAPQSSAALRPRLAALAQDLQAQQPAGVQKSNVGGWQSDPDFMDWDVPELASLRQWIHQAFGSIMGRNAFQRPKKEAIELLHRVQDAFAQG